MGRVGWKKNYDLEITYLTVLRQGSAVDEGASLFICLVRGWLNWFLFRCQVGCNHSTAVN